MRWVIDSNEEPYRTKIDEGYFSCTGDEVRLMGGGGGGGEQSGT